MLNHLELRLGAGRKGLLPGAALCQRVHLPFRRPNVHSRSASVARPRAVTSQPGASLLVENSAAPASSNGEESYNWNDQWYPIAFVKDIDPSKPYRFVLLNTPLVVWWEPAAQGGAQTVSSSSSSSGGAWRVFKDACPHRLVPLSEGRINAQGQLECGYHGWAFSGSGSCQAIPQQGDAGSRRACATAFPSAVRQGLLFVKPLPLPPAAPATSDARAAAAAAAAADEARIPIVPELEDADYASQDVWRDLPMDWSTLMENVLDFSHVPFTHHKTISNRNIIGDYDCALTEPVSRQGFQGAWATGPRAGQLGPQRTLWRSPGLLRHTLDAKEKRGFESMTIVYAVPTTPGNCRLINRNCFKFFKGPSALLRRLFSAAPNWYIHLRSHIPLEDDQIFLHLGELEYLKEAAQGKSAAQAYYMPSKADTYVLALRSWMAVHGGGGPFGPLERQLQLLQPRQGRDQLLDRFGQHTAHCAQCQKGLQQVGGALAVAVVARNVAVGLAVLAAAVALASGVSGMASTGSAFTTSTGASSTSWLAAAAGGFCISAVRWVVCGGAAGGLLDPVRCVVQAGAWALAAAALHLIVVRQLRTLQSQFFTGTYPPLRNTARD